MHVDPLVPFQQHVIGPGAVPPPSNESMADAEMVVGLAPEIERLDVFVSPSGDLVKTIGDLLTAALDPANTGGERVDIISISYETCEPTIDPSDPDFVHAEALLQQAAEEGVWILKGEGDSGSSGCAPKGDCTKDPHTHFLAVDWPSTSPWVISTGGTMLPENAPVVGTPGVVWGEPAPVCGGTGGGVSILFPRPDWQRDYPGPVVDPTGKRMVPDVASLAGSPGFELYTPGNPPEPEFKWRPIEGDSMTGPLWAGAMAVVKSALVGQGITVPVMLNPELYRLASDPDDVRDRVQRHPERDERPLQPRLLQRRPRIRPDDRTRRGHVQRARRRARVRDAARGPDPHGVTARGTNEADSPTG